MHMRRTQFLGGGDGIRITRGNACGETMLKLLHLPGLFRRLGVGVGRRLAQCHVHGIAVGTRFYRRRDIVKRGRLCGMAGS